MTNTEAGIAVMRTKLADVDTRNGLYDTYLSQLPGVPQPIPARPTLVTMYGVELNSREACSIIGYNGYSYSAATGVGQPTFTTPNGNYRTCWYYEHNTTANTWSWVFHDNHQTYLQRILETSE